jgi:hypothetical protein
MTFVKREGSSLLLDDVAFRFISFNIPNLFIIEDPYWHQATEFEQVDALASIKEMGGKAVRVYPFSFQKSNADYPRHFKFSNGKWILNEELFKDIDRALVIAANHSVKIIIPFIDYWDYWGGIPTFTSLNIKEPLDFFTDSLLRQQFKEIIRTILDRVNSINGIKYKDDPTILAWETGNELEYNNGRVPSDWTLDISKFIKQLDNNHLVIDGSNGYFGWDSTVLSDSNIDIYSNHYYEPAVTRLETKQWMSLILLPVLWIILISLLIKSIFKKSPSRLQTVVNSLYVILFVIGYIVSLSLRGSIFPDISDLYAQDDTLIRSYNKIHLVGELGLHKIYKMNSLLTEFIPRTSTCGVLIWSLRFHSESGGFCNFVIIKCLDTHQELFNYWSYHYPGFPESPGFPPDELDLFQMVKSQTYSLNSIMKYPSSRQYVPISPVLWINTTNLFLKGSYGCHKYSLQYSNPSGDFTLVKDFTDSVGSGFPVLTLDSYNEGWYRVIAYNNVGTSVSNSVYYKPSQ